MVEYMRQYQDLLQDLLDNGVPSSDRTGVGTLRKAGHMMRFNLQDGFPLVTTKRMFFKGVVDELLWFISGSTNVNDLPERTRKWWSPWADANGELGFIYGKMLRSANHYNERTGAVEVVDQLLDVIEGIKVNPYSRRHIINLWHTPAMKHANLPCCHGSIIQFFVNEGKLSCMMTQRSVDVAVGLPVNVACYALLTHMIAQQTDLEVGELIWSGGDCHCYLSHLEGVIEQVSREPLPLPTLRLVKAQSITDYDETLFSIEDYVSHPVIKFEVAV